MQLANVRVAGSGNGQMRPLTADERRRVDAKMREKGALTPTEFKDAVRSATGCVRDNLETMLMHPDAKEALTLDPVQKLLTSNECIAALFAKLPARIQKRARGQLRHGKTVTLGQLRGYALAVGESVADFDEELQQQVDAAATKGRKKVAGVSRESLLAQLLRMEKISGRAAYSREILRKACEEVMAGKHPKEEGGCLFVTEQMRQAQIQREIDQQTNNHLVRHRLKILERLFRDIIAEYAGGDKSRIERITIEVNRDLREFSGKTAKEKTQDLGLRVADHHRVAEKLQKALAGQTVNGQPIRIGPGLIRKARIAEDLGWTCPYTGQKYEPIDLVTRRVDKDHIVPRSQRMSDSLDSLVITFSAINKWKGNRTALKFVEDEQGKPVPDLPNLSIVSLSRYREFVEKLETFKGHDDDKKRKKRRKALLLLRDYEEEEFTPRDLTQTSQLVRLGAQMLKRPFLGEKHQPVITSLPGSVTGVVRKGWNLLGCLSKACPQVLDETGEVRTKTDIREITHLHHAVDACVLGLAAHFVPNNGRMELIVKRNLTETEKLQLRALGVFDFSPDGFRLKELPEGLKNQIRDRLAERRVVQHIPKRMSGLRVEQNAWRVLKIEGDEATIRQRVRQPDGSRPLKETTERITKLFGLNPTGGSGKLKALKAALVIPDNFGIALDPEPTIIPFHKVWPRLQALKKANGGKWPRVLRSGQLIHVPKGRYQGTWRVFSTKNNKSGMAVDMGWADVVRLRNGVEGHKINVLLASLLRDGMTILDTPLTGVASPPL